MNHEDDSYNFSISYDEGIMPEHLLASASVPVNFDYTHVPTKYDYSSHAHGNRDYSAIDCNEIYIIVADHKVKHLRQNRPTDELILV